MAGIIIIGGGFAGLAALKKLAKSGLGLNITLIDKKAQSDFLPELPDVIGRLISPEFLTYDIRDLAKKIKFDFINEQVLSVDLSKQEVSTPTQKRNYDYLIIASGSETNFYDQEDVKRYAYKLDSVDDAKNIADAVKAKDFDHFIISGGGYTGVEVATNIKLYLSKRKSGKAVIIVERGTSLLGPLPQALKDYAAVNLRRLGVREILKTTVSKVERDKVILSTGETFARSMLIWTAGVRTDDFIQRLNLEKNPQGRLKVDEYLRVNERCFVAGDAANFFYQGNTLRMAVQFSILEGRLAASNIMNHIKGLRLKRYKPIDLGYIVPMANNRSCGIVMGLYVSGLPATFLHFAMCVYRSLSFKNKIGIIKDLIFKK